MSILLTLFESQERHAWQSAFAELLGDESVWMADEVPDPDLVQLAIIGRLPPEGLGIYPNLEAVLLLSAGVDHLIGPGYDTLDAIPPVPIVRLADPAMAHAMGVYALHWVIHYQRNLHLYREDALFQQWTRRESSPPGEFQVGILGYGKIGQVVGDLVGSLGYPINVWSRSERDDVGVRSFSGADSLERFLGASNLVINLLPLTEETRGMLDAGRLDQMRHGAFLVNIGRGGTVDNDALLVALDSGALGGAALDVFDPEPLPADSPLWIHPRVVVTPHMSGDTPLATAPGIVAANIMRIRNSEQPHPLFDRDRGY